MDVSIGIFIIVGLAQGGDVMIEEDGTALADYFIGALSMVFYYTITEYYLKGKTIAKFVTKTRAVTLEDQRMDFNTTFRRSLSRIVPFEAFSFLGDMPIGWHDRWTNTKVIMDINWEG